MPRAGEIARRDRYGSQSGRQVLVPHDALTRTFDAATGFAVREHARLLVLDEVCAAISCGFLDEKTVVKFLETKPETLEVVLTGRGPSEALQAHADYITEMKMQRHPFEKGIAAREGIEF